MSGLKNGETANEYIKRMEERSIKESNIFCPYCTNRQDQETKQNHITYWGEPSNDEDLHCYCSGCGKKFIVIEDVRRTYESKTLEDYYENDG